MVLGGHPRCIHLWETTTLITEVGAGNWSQGVNGRGEVQPGGVDEKRKAIKTKVPQGRCIVCNAWMGQLGLESTVDEYIEHVVLVFRELWRVLKKDGTVWVNIGDSWATNGGSGFQGTTSQRLGRKNVKVQQHPNQRRPPEGLKAKDMIGVPWMLAFALRADGWYLRSEIIWEKGNCMPESTKDRPTLSHERLFLLAKQRHYYYDHKAIEEPASPDTHARYKRGRGENHKYSNGNQQLQRTTAHMVDKQAGHGRRHDGFNERWENRPEGVHPKAPPDREAGVRANAIFSAAVKDVVETRQKRSVWRINPVPFSEAHYATFPPKLVEPCILAGSRPGDLVLDPFAGSGTVAMVAEAFGRRWVGCDLGYQNMQGNRLSTVQKELIL